MEEHEKEPRFEEELNHEFSAPIEEIGATAVNDSVIAEEIQEIEEIQSAPEGWMTVADIARETGCDAQTARKYANRLAFENTGLQAMFYHPKAHKNIQYYHPDLVARVRDAMSERSPAPEGWMTNKTLCTELNCAEPTTNRLAKEILKEHPEWRNKFMNSKGQVFWHYHPDLVARVRDAMSERSPAPEGWMTVGSIANELDVDHYTAKKLIDRCAKQNPDWEALYLESMRRLRPHYHPDLVARVRDAMSERSPAPEGWMTANALTTELGTTRGTIMRIVDRMENQDPELIKAFPAHGNTSAIHYHPTLIDLVRKKFLEHQQTDDAWLSKKEFADLLDISVESVENIFRDISTEDPDEIQLQKGRSGKVSEHIHMRLANYLKEHYAVSRTLAPDGWMTAGGFMRVILVNNHTIKKYAQLYRSDHPEWFSWHLDSVGKLAEHYSPELLTEIQEIFGKQKREQAIREMDKANQENLRENIEDFLTDIQEGESLEAQEFQGLMKLFGAERVVDILYQYRPEYKKMPVPYIKSVLADYLGDFLIVRGGLDFDALARGAELLYDPSLKEGLVSVIKADCLKHYNQLRRLDPNIDGLATFIDYIGHLREQTAGFTNEHLEDALDEIEAYYRSIFEDIHKPGVIKDELRSDRLFPDVNQRINIKEIEQKQKILIAGEMGTGKSASAILAKECLGVKQALIVAPSNVVDVWKRYLSDRPAEERKPAGYFKEGQAPRVLVVNGPDELAEVNPDDYDYVIISQERLTDQYTELLGKFDYDMLIVDEVHKLKNLVSGKRARNLVTLSEKIEGKDKYLALLSATPVPNKVQDIAMLLKLLYPEQFKDISDQHLVSSIYKGDMLDLRSLLVPRMQTQELAESIDMPQLHEIVHELSPSDKEREIYEILLEEDELSATEKMHILRKFTLDPRLVEATPGITGTKIDAVRSQLGKTFEVKDKVVMFVNGYIEDVIRGERTILEDLSQGLPDDIEIHTIEGDVKKEDRIRIQELLQQKGKRMLLAVSGQTADVGVDFSAAEAVFFYNDPWTYYDKRQQLGRTFRPGLESDLESHSFFVKGSIEEGIRMYVDTKFRVIEKLLHGIPISEIERRMLKHDDPKKEPDLEVNPELAAYYFSAWGRMMRFYSHNKEAGQDKFVEFLDTYGPEYAENYMSLGSRSYQANASRLSGALIDRFARAKKQKPQNMRILDIASGPEVLRRHIPETYAYSIISVDINEHHFKQPGSRKRAVGSFLALPIQDKSIDYANLALSLHYTSFLPSKGSYERVEALKEINRVLKQGGRAVISLMYTLDLKDKRGFYEAVSAFGFKVVEEYSGKTEGEDNFKTRVITLEKVRDCTKNTLEIVHDIGRIGRHPLKLTPVKDSVRDSRKIVTSYSLGTKIIQARLNKADRAVYKEEQKILGQMARLKERFGSIKDIPEEEIVRRNFARVFVGRHYLLFKRLESGPGAVRFS